MNSKSKYVAITLIAAALGGCADGHTKQDIGMLAGGAAGAALGATVFHGDSQLFGALGGAALGAVLGGAVGRSMDEQDRINTQQAMINTQIGQQASWTNQKTGANYTVKPVREFKKSTKNCRYAETIVTVDGKTEQAYTTICQDAKGGPWYVEKK